MIQRGAGSIVNMSSGAGVIGIRQTPIYDVSKHAVLGLTKSTAVGYAKSGIRINAVASGLVNTDMIASMDKQFMDTSKSMHPIGCIADPKEVANAVVWLLSDKASFCSRSHATTCNNHNGNKSYFHLFCISHSKYYCKNKCRDTRNRNY